MQNKVLINFILGLTLSLGFAFCFTTASAVKHIINVSNYAFSPATITNVAVGDTIRWQWVSGFHTTYSITSSIPANAATWSTPINSSTTIFEYKVSVPGNYVYACNYHGTISSNGTPGGMSGSFQVNAATGLQEAGSSLNAISIYPKPANDALTVKMNAFVASKGQVILYDIQGNEVQREYADLLPGSNLIHFSIGALSKGQYFVEIYSDKKRLSIQKILKD
jgi:plastocyanin